MRRRFKFVNQNIFQNGMCAGNPEKARTSDFFGSVKPEVFCQKSLKLSFPTYPVCLHQSDRISLVTFLGQAKKEQKLFCRSKRK